MALILSSVKDLYLLTIDYMVIIIVSEVLCNLFYNIFEGMEHLEEEISRSTVEGTPVPVSCSQSQ